MIYLPELEQHSPSLLDQRARHHRQQQQTIVLLSDGLIDEQLLTNFAEVYHALGGQHIPDEIVNCIIRRAEREIRVRHEWVSRHKALQQISQLIASFQPFSPRERWRLANTFCHYHYGFQIPYHQWLLSAFYY